MKRIVFLLTALSLLFCFRQLNAQTFRPLPDSNAYWVTSVAVEISMSSFQYTLKTPSFFDDTIINSKKYTKVFQVDYPWYPYSLWDLKGCYRNDSLGRAYFIWADSSNEHILYDINCNIGDTVFDIACWDTYWNPQNYYAIIQDTQNIVIGNKSFRKIGFNYSDEIPGTSMLHYWLEGIGNVEGIINPHNLGMNSSMLICMSAYDTAWYPYYSLVPCDWFGVSVTEAENHKFSISPNPTNGIIQIKCTDTPLDMSVYIYNTQGQLIYKSQVLQEKALIDISLLSSGLYLFRVESPYGIEIKKILKE